MYYRLPTEFEKSATLKTRMDRSTRSHLNVVPSMVSPKAALRASHATSLEMARWDASDDILKFSWEESLNDESQPWHGEVAAEFDDVSNIKHESWPTKIRCEENGNVIVREMKSVVKNLVANKMVKMVETALDNVLCKTFYNVRCLNWFVVQTQIQQRMFDLLRKQVIVGKTAANIAKWFDTDEAAEGF